MLSARTALKRPHTNMMAGRTTIVPGLPESQTDTALLGVQHRRWRAASQVEARAHGRHILGPDERRVHIVPRALERRRQRAHEVRAFWFFVETHRKAEAREICCGLLAELRRNAVVVRASDDVDRQRLPREGDRAHAAVEDRAGDAHRSRPAVSAARADLEYAEAAHRVAHEI